MYLQVLHYMGTYVLPFFNEFHLFLLDGEFHSALFYMVSTIAPAFLYISTEDLQLLLQLLWVN